MSDRTLSSIPSGHDGQGYVTIGGRVVEALRIRKVDARVDMTKESKRFLGERMTRNAVRGMSGSGNLSWYNSTSALAQAMAEYKAGGEYPQLTLQYYAETPSAGRQEVILRGVILENVSFGALDDSSDESQVCESPFSFDDFDILSAYNG